MPARETKIDFYYNMVKDYHTMSPICSELEYGLFIYNGDLYFKYDNSIYLYIHHSDQTKEIKDLDYDDMIDKRVKTFSAKYVPMGIHRLIINLVYRHLADSVEDLYKNEEDWNHPIMNTIYRIDDLLEQDPN